MFWVKALEKRAFILQKIFLNYNRGKILLKYHDMKYHCTGCDYIYDKDKRYSGFIFNIDDIRFLHYWDNY